MIVTSVECEMCSNNFRVHPQERPREWNVPEGWLKVFAGNPQHAEGWHFCSPACLRAWAVQKDKES